MVSKPKHTGNPSPRAQPTHKNPIVRMVKGASINSNRSTTGAQLEFTVVGIGASAGGLDAFKEFLLNLPVDSGFAFVLIQHLDPTHESLTAEILSKFTAMMVIQVTQPMAIEPNHIYVIPPNKYLAISDGTLFLTPPVERRGLRTPINFFFSFLGRCTIEQCYRYRTLRHWIGRYPWTERDKSQWWHVDGANTQHQSV